MKGRSSTAMTRLLIAALCSSMMLESCEDNKIAIHPVISFAEELHTITEGDRAPGRRFNEFERMRRLSLVESFAELVGMNVIVLEGGQVRGGVRSGFCPQRSE